MTDFVRDLEAELLAAAHRRSARRRTWRLPLRPILVTATALAVVLAAVTLIPRPAPGRTLRYARRFRRARDDGTRDLRSGRAPLGPPAEQAEALLAVLVRIPRAGDQLPLEFQTRQSTWLPARDWNGRSSRPAGAPFVVLGTNDVLARPLACGDAQSRGPGACLVAPGKTREALRVRCFTLDEIKTGRAFAVLDGNRLVGLVPDLALEVVVTVGERTVRLPARENAVSARIPGLDAGGDLSVRLDGHRPVVAAINETSQSGLAATVAATLRGRIDATVIIDWGNQQSRKRTFVRPTRPEAESLAMRIAIKIGASLDPTSKAPRGTPGNPDVVILVGSDRMR